MKNIKFSILVVLMLTSIFLFASIFILFFLEINKPLEVKAEIVKKNQIKIKSNNFFDLFLNNTQNFYIKIQNQNLEIEKIELEKISSEKKFIFLFTLKNQINNISTLILKAKIISKNSSFWKIITSYLHL